MNSVTVRTISIAPARVVQASNQNKEGKREANVKCNVRDKGKESVSSTPVGVELVVTHPKNDVPYAIVVVVAVKAKARATKIACAS